MGGGGTRVLPETPLITVVPGIGDEPLPTRVAPMSGPTPTAPLLPPIPIESVPPTWADTPPDPDLRATAEPRPRWAPVDATPAKRSRRLKMLGIASALGLVAIGAAVLLEFRVDIERHTDLVTKVQDVGRITSNEDADLVEVVDRLDDERQRGIADLTAEREARAQADTAAATADAARDDAEAKSAALASIFPLTVEALRTADFTNPTLTATATPIEGGCSGLLLTPLVPEAGCGVSHVAFTRTFSLSNDGTWHLRSDGYADVALTLDQATGTLIGSAPITLGWPCYDGTVGATGTLTVSLSPDSWSPAETPPALHVVRFQGSISEDGAADGPCAFSGMRWTVTYAG